VSKYPTHGMKYDQAIKTAIRHGKDGAGNIVESMASQVQKAEGSKAASEFRKEVSAKSGRD